LGSALAGNPGAAAHRLCAAPLIQVWWVFTDCPVQTVLRDRNLELGVVCINWFLSEQEFPQQRQRGTPTRPFVPQNGFLMVTGNREHQNPGRGVFCVFERPHGWQVCFGISFVVEVIHWFLKTGSSA
jgi:hypothetical protein